MSAFFDYFLKTKQYSLTIFIIDTYVLRKQSKKTLKKLVTFLAFRYLSLYVANLGRFDATQEWSGIFMSDVKSHKKIFFVVGCVRNEYNK